MELMNKFATIPENLSAKFPDLDEFYLYIHILGYVSGFDQPLFFDCHSGIAPLLSHFTFDKDTLQKIEKSFPFSVNQLSEEEKKSLCKYLLERCLQFERRTEIEPKNPAKFFDDIAVADSQAVSNNNGNYSINLSELSEQSYKQFIDWNIERYFYYKTPRIPKQINEKIVEIAEPKNGQMIYDPNCGDGSLFVEFYNKFPDAGFTFNGVVENQLERLFCLVNFYTNGILDDKRIEFEIEVSSPLADEISYRNRKNEDDYYFPPETANVAVSFVPSKRQLTEGERDSRFFGLSYSLEQPEYAYIELMLSAVNKKGKAIAIVPDSILYSSPFSSESRFFREAYLSRDWIESVISLPKNSFNQTDLSEFSVVVFNKNKLKKGLVVFDGEDSKFERTEIKNGAILSENNTDLRAARYALKEIKIIRNLIERHQKKNSENSIVSSIENITLDQYFDDLAETFSEKFPTTKNTVYLYLLIVVMMILDGGNQWSIAHNSFLINPRIYNEIKSHIYHRYYEQIIDVVLNQLANKGLSSHIKVEYLLFDYFYGIETESPVKDAFRELSKNLIARCLQIEGKVEPRNIENLWKEFAKSEPNAVQLENQHKTLDFERLKERLSSGINHVQIGKYNFLVDFKEFPDKAYQELSESFIAQSFSYERNYLQRFDGLDKTLAKISNPKPKQEIFNPNCGIGSLFIELQNQFPHHDLRFTGRVDDNFFYILCKANLLAHNVNASVSEQDILDSDIEFTFFGDNPDIAFGIVPFGLEVLGRRDKKFFPLSHKRKNVEYSLIELLINSLNETGKAVVVVPEGFLHTGHAKGFKKEYLKNDWVESVISLPEDTFGEYSSVKASIVVFNKNKAEKGFITFKSLDSQFEETKVGLNKILSSGSFDLRVSRYASEAIKELDSILKKYPPGEVKSIKDLIDSSVSGIHYSPGYRIAENALENLPYVRVKDLSNSNKDFTLDVSKVERVIPREKARKKTVIDYPAVLVSKIAPKIKPTLFNFVNQPIVIGSDVLALKVKTEIVGIEYFLTQLESRLVQTQVEMFSFGNIINRISESDFLNIQIILPPLPERELQIFERSAVGKDKAIAEEKIEKAEEEIQQTEYDVIATISHNLSQKLGKIGDDYNTLIRRLKRAESKSAQKFNELFGDKEVFDKVVNRLHRNIEDANETMTTTTRILQKNKISVDSVNVLQFLKDEIIKNYSRSNFEISIETKLRSLFVPIDKDALKDAIRNLIENAQKHGFKDVERKFQIVFEISKKFVSDGTEYASIIFKNDGESLPEGFSFDEYKRLGGRAGETKGTGLGGFWINKVIALHKGKFNYIPVEIDSSSPYKVVFEILLPLE